MPVFTNEDKKLRERLRAERKKQSSNKNTSTPESSSTPIQNLPKQKGDSYVDGTLAAQLGLDDSNNINKLPENLQRPYKVYKQSDYIPKNSFKTKNVSFDDNGNVQYAEEPKTIIDNAINAQKDYNKLATGQKEDLYNKQQYEKEHEFDLKDSAFTIDDKQIHQPSPNDLLEKPRKATSSIDENNANVRQQMQVGKLKTQDDLINRIDDYNEKGKGITGINPNNLTDKDLTNIANQLSSFKNEFSKDDVKDIINDYDILENNSKNTGEDNTTMGKYIDKMYSYDNSYNNDNKNAKTYYTLRKKANKPTLISTDLYSTNNKLDVNKFINNTNNGTLSDEQVQSFLTNETVPEEIRSKLAYAYNSFNKNTYNNQIQQQLNNNNSLSTAYKTSANKFVKMANEIINAPSKEDGSYGIVNYGKGFWNTLRDRDTFTLGISELLRDNNLRLASNNFKKWYEKYKEELINKGDKDYQNKATQMAFNTLANDDKQLINSYMLYNNMAARRGIDLSKAYNAGGATAQSVEFMTEMMIGSGIAGGIKNAVKTGVKKFTTRGIKEEVLNTAKNTVNNAYVQGLKDYASKTLKPFLKNAVTPGTGVATTVISPHTYSQMAENAASKHLAGEEYTTKDFLGDVSDALVNNVTETLGTEAFYGLTKGLMAFTGISKPLANLFSKVKASNPRLRGLVYRWNNGNISKFLNDRTYLADPIGELAEEYEGAGLNTLTGYALDDEDRKNSWKEFMKKDNQAVLFGSILPMTSFFGGVRLFGNTKVSSNYKQAKYNLVNVLNDNGIDTGKANRLIQAFELNIGQGKAFEDDGKMNKGMVDIFTQIKQITNNNENVNTAINNYLEKAQLYNQEFNQFKDNYNNSTPEEKDNYLTNLADELQVQAENAVRYNDIKNNVISITNQNGQDENYILEVKDQNGDRQGVILGYRDNGDIIFKPDFSTPVLMREQQMQENFGEDYITPLKEKDVINSLLENMDKESPLYTELQTKGQYYDYIHKNSNGEEVIQQTTLKDGKQAVIRDIDEQAGVATVGILNEDGTGYTMQQIGIDKINEETTETPIKDISLFANQTNNTIQQQEVIPQETTQQEAIPQEKQETTQEESELLRQAAQAIINYNKGLITKEQQLAAQKKYEDYINKKQENTQNTEEKQETQSQTQQQVKPETNSKLNIGDVILFKDRQGNSVKATVSNVQNNFITYDTKRSDGKITHSVINSNLTPYDIVQKAQQQQQQQIQTTPKQPAKEQTQQPAPETTTTNITEQEDKQLTLNKIKETYSDLAEKFIATKEKELADEKKKLNRQKNKYKTDQPEWIIEEKRQAQIKKDIDNKLQYWNEIHDLFRKEQEQAKNAQAKQTRDKKTEELNNRVKGNTAFEKIVSKFRTGKKVLGNKSQKILANGQVVNGQYILVSANDVTPSHNVFNDFAKSEGFPETEDGRTINDRDYQRDKEAQGQVIARAEVYDGRAIQDSPIVDDNGIVLSGNDRTMSGQLAAQKGTDGKYIEYLNNNAGQYGFTQEQVQSISNPRLVFMIDEELPYTTNTFAMFNANEKKTQNITEQAVKIGKTIKAVSLRNIARIIERYESIRECLNDRQGIKDIISILTNDGILQTNDVAQFINNGAMTEAGKEYIETLLIGSLLNEESVRIVNVIPFMRQSILTSLNEILDDFNLNDDYTLKNELDRAIQLVYRAKKFGIKQGEKLTPYLTQYNLDGTTNLESATVQLLADRINSNKVTELKKVLSLYNEAALQASNGQMDMFTGKVLSKEDILRNILKQQNYDTRTIQITKTNDVRDSSKTESTNGRQSTDERGRGEENSNPTDVRRGTEKETEITSKNTVNYFDNTEIIHNFANEENEQLKWLQENLQDIISQYISKYGNKLDPDEARKAFIYIGYTGENVPSFRKVEKKLISALYDEMLEKVIEKNPTITFLTGVAGSGKSTATQRYSEELNNRGLVYDSALNRYGKLDELIKYAQEKGIKDVEVIAVYNDPITAFKNTIARGTRTDKSLPNGNGRLVPLKYFTESFKENIGKIQKLYDDYNDKINIKAIDNTNNQAKEVTIQEAINWNYQLTDEQRDELYNIVINNTLLNDDKIQGILKSYKRRARQDNSERIRGNDKSNTQSGTNSRDEEVGRGRYEVDGGRVSDEVRSGRRGLVEETPKTEEKSNNETNTYGSKNKIVSTERYKELEQRMKDKLKHLNSGFDPEILAIGTEMAMYHIESGTREFIPFAKKMIDSLGEKIIPFLKSFYEGARFAPDMEELAKEMNSQEDVAKFDLNTLKPQEKETETETTKKISNDNNELNLFSNDNNKSENEDENIQRRSGRTQTGVGGGTPQEAQRIDGRRIQGGNSGDILSNGLRSGRVHQQTTERRLVEEKPQEENKEQQQPSKLNTNNYHNLRGVSVVPNGNEAKIKANIAAIKLMKKLIADNKPATKEQMEVLKKYCGWGGLSSIFKEDNKNYQTLKDLLDDEEYEAARASTTTAFYTPIHIIDTLWDIVRRLGFKNGTILESSAGIGNILGQIPIEISNKSKIQAIELDSVSGNILKLLYPDSNITIGGFEDQRIKNGSIDLAITNVPFGNIKVFDKIDTDLSNQFKNIHDFFIAKNIRKLKEGGLGVFISSSGTLDKSTDLRKWITSQGNADVIGAFRLNSDTFKNEAGTEATSDIIIVRKRINGVKSDSAIDVLDTKVIRSAEYKTGEEEFKDGEWISKTALAQMSINNYFAEHPENMAGVMKFGFEGGNTLRPTEQRLAPDETKDTQTEKLSKWLDTLPKDIINISNDQTQKQDNSFETKEKEGSLLFKDNKFFIVENGTAVEDETINNNNVKGHTKEECFNDYLNIKTTLNDLLTFESQTNEEDNNKEFKIKLKALNDAYDTFINKYGNLNKNISINFLSNDVDFPAIQAIEKVKETPQAKGKTQTTFEKTDVFSQRVVNMPQDIHPTNIKEGLIASVYKYNRINTEYIAKELYPDEDVNTAKELVKNKIIEEGIGFEDPVTANIETRMDYLSGNVREKLRQAEANNENGVYDKNIEELKKVMPKTIPAHLINVTLGSSWLPTTLYEKYFMDTFGVETKVRFIGNKFLIKNLSYSADDNSKGVVGFISGSEIAANVMQGITKQVYNTYKDPDGTKHQEINKEVTQQIAVKAQEIKDGFIEWYQNVIQKDVAINDQVTNLYNEQFNNSIPKKIDDIFLPDFFDGATHSINLYPHQKVGVLKAINAPTLFAHEVGTGKTITLITTAMEMRRLGTAKKPLIVVQGSTIGQFVASAKKLYPNIKILAPSKKDKEGDNRRKFFAKIRYNDWDIVVIPHSTLDFIPDNPARVESYIQEKIQEKEDFMATLDPDDKQQAQMIRAYEKDIEKYKKQIGELQSGDTKTKRGRSVKDKEKTKANVRAKMGKILNRRTDETAYFEDLGVDALLIDEAHNYKHLGFNSTRARSVKGIDTSESKRAQGVYLKTRYVLEKNGWKNVAFATGTPISNTAAEMWTFMKYFLPKETLEQYGISTFDNFINNFGTIEESVEYKTNGKFAPVTRFTSYNNMPELMRVWGSFADTVLTKDVEVKDKVPDIEGGEAKDLFLEQNTSLRFIMSHIKAELQRYENMTGKEKLEHRALPLTMFSLAKIAAIDPRLADSSAKDEENSKTNETVKQTMIALNESQSYKGTVAIFCDNYQNKKSGFNLFEDIKEKLIKNGIPEEQIAIIHDYKTDDKKEKLFSRVKSGDVRVILGTTSLLGTGVNIQERLFCEINMDAPARPSDYLQRVGRIIRQGNIHKEMNKPVRLIRLGVKDTLDVTAYQRLKIKQNFIQSVMQGANIIDDNLNNRAIEETDETAIFDNPVAMLSGSEFALAKTQAEQKLRKLKAKKKTYENSQIYDKNKLDSNKTTYDNNIKLINTYNNIIEKIKAKKENTVKEVTINNKTAKGDKDIYKLISDNITKSLNDVITEMEDNFIIKKYVDFKIRVNDFDVNVNVFLNREYDNKNKKSVVHTKVKYSIPDLLINNLVYISGATSVQSVIKDINTNVLSLKRFTTGISQKEQQNKDILNENKTLETAFGKPFADEQELKDTEKQVDDLTQKMIEEQKAKDEENNKALKEAGIESSNIDINKLAEDTEEDNDNTNDDTVQAQYVNDDKSTYTPPKYNSVIDETLNILLQKSGIKTNTVSQEELQRLKDKGAVIQRDNRFEILRKSDFDEDGNITDQAKTDILDERNEINAQALKDGNILLDDNGKYYCLAPNGKRSNLTVEQWITTRTKRFKEWFGDWEKIAELKSLDSNFSIIENNEETPDEAAKGYDIIYNGKKIGRVALIEAPNGNLTIRGIGIDENIRGKGIGKNLYKWLIYKAYKNGGTLYSDNVYDSTISPSAHRVWKSLIKEGFAVEDNYSGGYHSVLNASKVVDENGEPLVVYHGTSKEFNTFDKTKIGSNTNNIGIFGNGFYFTQNQKLAQDYDRTDGNITKENKGNTLSAFLNIKNPFIWSDKQSINIANELSFPKSRIKDNKLLPITNDKDIVNFTNELRARGLDGVIYKYDNTTSEYVAFNPNQIKSATKNNGTYNKDNEDIRFSVNNNDYKPKEFIIQSSNQKSLSAKEQESYAEDIKKKIEEKGYKNIFISQSKTSFGISTYVKVFTKDFYPIAKIRISDHSTTNKDRMNEEIHTYNINEIDKVLKEFEGFEKYAKWQYNKDVLYLRKPNGKIYGAVYKGEIYLDKDIATPDTKIHEYTHVWDNSCQKVNPTLWKQGVELMKKTSVWNDVVNDPNYADIKNNDNLVASEVHARLTGKDGEKLLRQLSDEASSKGTSAQKLSAKMLIFDLKEWLKKFWYWLKDTQTNWTKDYAKQVTLDDFINMPIADLVKGTQLYQEENIAVAQSQFQILSDNDNENNNAVIKGARTLLYNAINKIKNIKDVPMAVREWFDDYAEIGKIEKYLRENGGIVKRSVYSKLIAKESAIMGRVEVYQNMYCSKIEQTIQKITNNTNLTRKDIGVYLLLKYMPQRTADNLMNLYYDKANILENIRKLKEDLTDDKLLEAKRIEKSNKIIELEQQINIINGIDDIINNKISREEKERIRKDVSDNMSYDDISSLELEDINKAIDNKIDREANNEIIHKACEQYRDDVMYSNNIAGIQGLDGENDLYKTELYKKLINSPKDENRTRITPYELAKILEDKIGQKNADELHQDVLNAKNYIVDLAKEYGAISQDEHDRYIQDEWYVPSRGWDDVSYKVYGNDTNRQKLNEQSKGRTTIPDDPLKYIYAMGVTSITDAVNKDANNALLEMFLDNKDLLLGKGFTIGYSYIDALQQKERGGNPIRFTDFLPTREEYSDIVEDNTNNNNSYTLRKIFGNDKIIVKVFDEDFERAYKHELDKHIVTIHKDGVAYKLGFKSTYLTKILNHKTDKKNSFIKVLGWATSKISSIFTSKNPSFTLRNLLRDVQTATLLNENATKNFRINFFKYLTTSGTVRRAIFDSKNTYKGTNLTQEQKDMLNEYNLWLQYGGQSGNVFFNSDLDSICKKFTRQYTAKNVSKVARGIFLLDYVNKLSEWTENQVRFCAYLAYKKEGMTTEEAALASKEATTNFSRKGRVSRIMNTFFPFFSAQMNGLFKIFRFISKKKWYQSITPFAIMLLSGFLDSWLSYLLGGNDDDKDNKYLNISNYLENTNLIIGNIKIPIAQELAPIFGLGAQIGRLYTGKTTPTKATYDIWQQISSLLPDEYNKLIDCWQYDKVKDSITLRPDKESWEEYGVNLLPQIIKPIGELLLTNKNFLGNNILPAENIYDKTESRASRYYDEKTFFWFKTLAYVYNNIFNSPLSWDKEKYYKQIESKYIYNKENKEPEKTKTLSPMDFQYISYSYQPFITNTIGTIYDLIKGNKDIAPENIPVVNAFYVKENKNKQLYEDRDYFRELNDLYSNTLKNKDSKKEILQDGSTNPLYKEYLIYKNKQSELKSIQYRIKALHLQSDDDIKKRQENKDKIQELQEKEENIYQEINKIKQ